MCSMSKVVAAFILGAFLFTTGCTHVYVPPEREYKTESIPEFKVSTKVDLINGQPNTEEILYAENMGHDFLANLNDWTDTAIGITNRELIERGASASGKAGKSLKLKVDSVKVTTGGWGFRGYVTLVVETGSGLKKSFKAEAPAANLYYASSGALSASVGLMLSDPAIISYLEK